MEIVELPLDKIKANPNQPRKEFNKEALQDLAQSIETSGLINPIHVKKDGDDFIIVSGERRWRAFNLLGKKTIPVIINKNDGDFESLIENLHRKDLTLEEIGTYSKQLMEKYNLTPKQIAEKIGLGRRYIQEALRYVKLPQEVKDVAPNLNQSDKADIYHRVKSKSLSKRIMKEANKNEWNRNDVRNVINIANQTPDLIKPIFKEEISIPQAKNISLVSDENKRTRMIEQHKKLLKDISKKRNYEAKNIIQVFRENAIESEKLIQRTIQSLLICKKIMPIIDEQDRNKMKYHISLWNDILLSGSGMAKEVLK